MIPQEITESEMRPVAAQDLGVLLRGSFAQHIIQHQGGVCAWQGTQLEWNTVRQD